MIRKRNANITINTIVLIALVFTFNMIIAPIPANAGAGDLTVALTAPSAELTSSGVSEVVYQVDSLVDYQNVSFVWNFSNGLDTYLSDNKQKITLRTAGGDSISINYDSELVYTKQNTPVELRQFALTMVDRLQPDTNYIVELDPDITSNNGNTLGKTYSWHFLTTAEEAGSDDSGPVSWPDGSQVKASNITPNTLTLTWTEATGASQYKVYQDDSEIKTLSSSVLSCNITGLTAKTSYVFKVEAGDAADVFTTNGPSAIATTAGQLEIAAYSPVSTEVPDAAKIDYQVASKLQPDGIHFVWDFSKGIDKKLVSNLSKITLKKSDGTEVSINRGSLTQAEISGDIIELGDFKYTKQAYPELRRLEFILACCTLEEGATYKLKLGSDIEANNGDKLWLNHLWTFTTAVADSSNDEENDDGTGTITEPVDAMSVDFDAVDLSPENTELWLDFSKGIDENLSSNAAQIQVYEEASGKSVSYDYEYIREGKTETGDKVRRLVLYLNDLEPRTTYEIEISEDVTANNGTTLDDDYVFEFTTKASSTSTEDSEEVTEEITEEVTEEIVPENQLPATPANVSLNDINGHWAQASIEQLVSQGAISGYPDGSFQPSRTITRAEFAYVLVKALDLEPKSGKTFADTASHWAREAIATAEGYGIVNGYDDNRFGPDDVISREQICVMLQKAFQLTTVGEGKAFSDSNLISEWAISAVCAGSVNGVVSGYADNTFRPQNGAARAEAVSMIVRAKAVNSGE